MNRRVLVAIGCSALGFALACGKYGPPERIEPSAAATASTGPAPTAAGDAQVQDEEKSPKR